MTDPSDVAPRARSAVVVGAGIGGLAAAVGLARRGWDVTVLERATSLEPVGAGIALAPNAVRALDALGVAGEVRSMAALQGAIGIRRADGRWLVRADATRVGEAFGEQTVVVHRARLVDLLVRALPDGALRTGVEATVTDPGSASDAATVRVSSVSAEASRGGPGGVRTRVAADVVRTDRDAEAEPSRDDRFAADASGRGDQVAHEVLRADLVVAADGIDSRTRRALFPEHPGPVSTEVTAWRFVVPAVDGLVPAETWGRGSVVGLTPLADGRVYGYATASLPPGTRFDDPAAELRRRFGSWHAPIPAVLDGLDASAVLQHDLRWLATPLPRFHVGRVAFLGDAAHAMTPNLGQGGCQALEDAVTLAALVGSGVPDVPDGSGGPARTDGDGLRRALAAYTAQRLPRTRRVQRMSSQVGAPTTWTSPVAVAVRDTLMAVVGRVAGPLLVRRTASVVDWHPPAEAASHR